MAQARLVEEMWSLPNFGGFYSLFLNFTWYSIKLKFCLLTIKPFLVKKGKTKAKCRHLAVQVFAFP